MVKSLQETFAANSICYGCGPANPKGLHLRSFVNGDHLIAHFKPETHHHAFPSVLNGGIIGSILDCHCNWAAAYFLMKDKNLSTLPSTVTSRYEIKLLKPTPMDETLTLTAYLKAINGNNAIIYGELMVNDTVTASCDAKFVAVKEGHPAFHRW